MLDNNELITGRWWELYHAVLTEIALNSSDITIEQLRSYLARHWKDRKHISAQQAEDLVAGVLRDYYGGEIQRVTANANSPDGGIDLLIVSADGVIKRAIQVKRRITRDVESVKDVRNFVGAMLLSGNDTGIFVTTASRFSRTSSDVAANQNLLKHRLALELIDGERLLELLEFTNLQREVALPPLVDLNTEWIEENSGGIFTARQLFFNDISRLPRT